MSLRRRLAMVFLVCSCTQPVSAENLAQWHLVKGGSWEVPRTIALDVERELQELIPKKETPEKSAHRNLEQYTVQYQGVLESGSKLVQVNGACETRGQSAAQLKANWLRAFDGGSCYFEAIYDPFQKKVVRLRFNGLA